LPSLFTEA
jgi:hypothetical protein